MYKGLARSRNRFYISAPAVPINAERIAELRRAVADARIKLDSAKIAAEVTRQNAINILHAFTAGENISREQVQKAQDIANEAKRIANEFERRERVRKIN